MHLCYSTTGFFHLDVRNSCKKVTVWLELCGNSDMLRPFSFDRNVNEQAYLENNQVLPVMARIFENQFQNKRFMCL